MPADGIKPEFWGIDPDALYPWTPRSGREVIAPESVGDGGKKIPAVLGKALPGAPVILVSATTEKDFLAIERSRSEYIREKAKLDAEGKSGLTEGLLVFSDELVSQILRAAVKNIRIRGPRGMLCWDGDWEKDEIKIRPWRMELFFDIVNGAAYEAEEVEGFTLRPASQPA